MQIPLTDVASIKLTSGASFIYREGQERYIPIKFSVRGRDLGTTVLEAQKKVDEAVAIPGGYHLEWVGEFGNLQEAIARLAVVIPIAIVLICMLLYINFASLGDMLLAASVIPMALIGGIFALYFTDTPFSVSAAIGFVALFGIAAMDGIIVLTAYNSAIEAGLDRTAAILRTGQMQMRPVLMTCVVACVGLLPAAVSTGIGSQVQKPLALVVVGGILLAPVLILDRSAGADRRVFNPRPRRGMSLRRLRSRRNDPDDPARTPAAVHRRSCLLAACTVGPDFKTPDPPAVPGYTAATVARADRVGARAGRRSRSISFRTRTSPPTGGTCSIPSRSILW